MADLEKRLHHWVEAHLIDAITAERILEFERGSGKGKLRWQAVLAISFGAVMLCAGILLFVAAHWSELSPGQRFTLVVAMVAVFHVAASVLGEKVPSIGTALHIAGTICLGAGIYLAAQIFHLQEHWPNGVLIWAVGAIVAWLVLRQWPQALLAAVLLPWWLIGEWFLAAGDYGGHPWSIAAQGIVMLSLLYISATARVDNRALRLGLAWIGTIALLPFLVVVMFSGHSSYGQELPSHLVLLGYAAAYLPVLAVAAILRKNQSVAMFVAAVWVLLLTILSWEPNPEHNLMMYAWVGVGACAFCYWGVRENRSLFINLGTVIFALDVIEFYFSDVLDKLGRSIGLILLGALFLAGGWMLNNLRSNLIARAATGGSR
jgi:uncharacterized membrane protein